MNLMADENLQFWSQVGLHKLTTTFIFIWVFSCAFQQFFYAKLVLQQLTTLNFKTRILTDSLSTVLSLGEKKKKRKNMWWLFD